MVSTDKGNRSGFFEGLIVIYDEDGVLHREDIGFPDVKSLELGKRLVAEYQSSISSTHFSNLNFVKKNMDFTQRNQLTNNKRGDGTGLLSRLDDDQVVIMNQLIGAVLECREDESRSSSCTQFPANNPNGKSVNLDELKRMMLRTGYFNTHGVFASLKNVGKKGAIKIGRCAAGKRFGSNFVPIANDPGNDDDGNNTALSPATRVLFMKEYKIWNFIFSRCVSFSDVNEQRDCYVEMSEFYSMLFTFFSWNITKCSLYRTVNASHKMKCLVENVPVIHPLVQIDDVTIKIAEYLVGDTIVDTRISWWLDL